MRAFDVGHRGARDVPAATYYTHYCKPLLRTLNTESHYTLADKNYCVLNDARCNFYFGGYFVLILFLISTVLRYYADE